MTPSRWIPVITLLAGVGSVLGATVPVAAAQKEKPKSIKKKDPNYYVYVSGIT